MQKNTLIKIVLVSSLVLIAASCNKSSNTNRGDDYSSTPTPTQTMTSPTPSAVTATPTPKASASPTPTVKGAEVQAKTFTVNGSNFSFSPSEIKVNKGDKVKIIFKNTGGFHDFVIDEFNVKTASIGTDKSETVEFTADKAGTFEYYCSVGSHREMGMKGNLIVQ